MLNFSTHKNAPIKCLTFWGQSIVDKVSSLIKQRDGLKQEMLRLNDKLEAEAVLVREGKANNYYDYTATISTMDQQLRRVENAIEKDSEIRKAEYYGLNEGDYLFLLQDLYAKGLLVDLGLGTFDLMPFDMMGITSFGRGFLSFINEEEDEMG